MRKFVLLAAMAAVAMPGVATAQHHHDRDHGRDRHGSSHDRHDRHDRRTNAAAIAIGAAIGITATRPTPRPTTTGAIGRWALATGSTESLLFAALLHQRLRPLSPAHPPSLGALDPLRRRPAAGEPAHRPRARRDPRQLLVTDRTNPSGRLRRGGMGIAHRLAAIDPSEIGGLFTSHADVSAKRVRKFRTDMARQCSFRPRSIPRRPRSPARSRNSPPGCTTIRPSRRSPPAGQGARSAGCG